MLTVDPKSRPSATEVLSHPWFKEDFKIRHSTILKDVTLDFAYRQSLKSNGKLSIS
jgi:serine/threonine protein kinase